MLSQEIDWSSLMAVLIMDFKSRISLLIFLSDKQWYLVFLPMRKQV